MRLRIIPVLWAACALSWSSATAAEKALDGIPATAGLVIRYRRPEFMVNKRVLPLARKLDPKLATDIRRWKKELGTLIENPKLAGIDSRSDWWTFVFFSAGAPPATAYAVQEDNSDNMADALGDEYEQLSHGKWIFYTKDPEAAQQIADCLDGNVDSIATVMNAKSKGILHSNMVATYVNFGRMVDAFRPQLAIIRDEVDKMMADLPNITPKVPGIDLEPVFRMYGKVVLGVLQGINDLEGFAIGADIRGGELVIEQYLTVAYDSPTDQFLQSIEPSAFKRLTKLPANKLLYVATRINMSAFNKWGYKLTTALLPEEDERKETLRKMLAEYERLRFGDSLMAFDLEDPKTGLLRTTQVTEVDPITTVRKITRASAEALAELTFSGIKQDVELKIDAEQFGKDSADILIFKPEFDEKLDPKGIARKTTETMYGPEGITQRFVYLKNPDLMVTTVGGGKLAMTKAIAALKTASPRNRRAARSRTGSAKGSFEAVRGRLMEKANVMVLVDVPGMMTKITPLVAESDELPVPIDAEAIKNLKLKRSYSGFSLTLQSHGVEARTVIPVDQVGGVYKIVKEFLKMKKTKE